MGCNCGAYYPLGCDVSRIAVRQHTRRRLIHPSVVLLSKISFEIFRSLRHDVIRSDAYSAETRCAPLTEQYSTPFYGRQVDATHNMPMPNHGWRIDKVILLDYSHFRRDLQSRVQSQLYSPAAPPADLQKIKH